MDEKSKHTHIKIQYKYREYTVSEFCKRMERLERMLKLALIELTPDVCDYCVSNDSGKCEEGITLGCGNTACQFVYWRHYNEAKGLIENGNELDSGV